MAAFFQHDWSTRAISESCLCLFLGPGPADFAAMVATTNDQVCYGGNPQHEEIPESTLLY